MDDSGCVFDFAVGADYGGFAIGFDFVCTANRGAQALDHLCPEFRAVSADFWFQVFDKAAAQPWVFHDDGQAHHGHRGVGSLATFYQGFFDVGDDFADFKTHGWLLWKGTLGLVV
ncbi:hypothetical protein D3C77_451210 [compost metagenome]